MIAEEQKLKNIKDLQYSNSLNKQNILLVLIGIATISTIITEQEKLPMEKIYLIAALLFIGFFFILYFNNKLDRIINDVKKL